MLDIGAFKVRYRALCAVSADGEPDAEQLHMNGLSASQLRDGVVKHQPSKSAVMMLAYANAVREVTGNVL